MPQITVNEIDQSVVTRVVSDDRVKILVPAILSFGPTNTGDVNSVMTFTDVTDFNRKCGYTEAEFNPFVDDKSRIYARELIKRGGAVSVVRVNTGGSIAEFDIGGIGERGVPKSVIPNIAPEDRQDLTLEQARFGEVTQGKTTCTITGNNIIAGTISATLSVTDQTAGTFSVTDDGNGKLIIQGISDDVLSATINYVTGVVTCVVPTSSVESGYTPVALSSISYSIVKSEAVYKYKFCPQIESIDALYPGSFGNNLYISISQITTKNVAEAYQYANISVYYMDVKTNYNDDGTVSSRVVKSVTQLETKRVSTNPNDPYYFEDVEFEFIRINGTPNAREELSLVWSDIGASPQSNHRYSGFPTILLKYNVDRLSTYNFDCAFKDGSDFPYSPELLAKLRAGFKGYEPGEYWSIADVNQYVDEVYGTSDTTGIIASIYSDVADVYANFTDPYIYDFDFITSGGFTYTEYTVALNPESGIKEASIVIPRSPSVDGSSCYYTGITPIHQAMLNLVETRQDCIALFDVPKDYDKNAIIDYSGMLNTSYGTMHFPWCYVASPDYANTQILMAPSYIFLYTFLSNLDNNVDSQKWFPPAGVKRATARVVKRPYFEIGSVTLNAWQNDNTSRVNPIMKLKQYGYVIYGQYTTLQAIDLNTHSALESLNVRLISNVVKKKIFDVCLNLAFEPNTENLWNKFFAQMDEFLRFMKYNEGVYDYRIIMDKSTVTTDDINHLRCPGKVYIAPTRTAEFFDIDFIITEAGAIFN